MPGQKPTNDELAERIEFTRQLVAEGHLKYRIKHRLRKRYGADLKHQTIERYLRRARELILAQAGEDRGEVRCESLAFYRAVLANPKADVRHKLIARERIDKLLGLEIKTPDAPGPADVEQPAAVDAESRDAILARLCRAVHDRLGAGPGGSSPNGHANGHDGTNGHGTLPG